MTIAGWILFVFFAVLIIGGGIVFSWSTGSEGASIGVSVVLVILLLLGMLWYYNSTASGRRALTDEQSELANGLQRTITVYTADGRVVAEYTGKIDIEGNEGGYVLFDYNGKRYTYYNCFVESIAEIP